MFKDIFLFELKYRMGRPATWAYFAILLVFGIVTGIYGGTPASEKTFVNSPYAITYMLITISIFGILIASAVMGVPVYRDIEHGVKNYLFSYPISEKSYLLGRYMGSLVILLLITLGFHIGLMVGFGLGPIFELEDPERFGPFRFTSYIQPTLLYYWPNLILFGTIFFSLVAFTKKVTVTYVGSILAFIGYLLAITLAQDLDNRDLVDILDPFAFTTFDNATRYLTPVEQNTMLMPFEGNLVWNRLIWSGVALSVFLITLFRFDFQQFMSKKLGKERKVKAEKVLTSRKNIQIPTGKKLFSNGIYLRHMFRLAWLEFRNIVRDPYFIAIMLGGILFLFLDGWFGSQTYGTPSLPTTYYMLEAKDGTYIIFVFILIIFYTGEVVHRDRSVKYDGIANALPVPNWLIYGSKFLALVMVCFLLVNLVWIVGISGQTVQGYFHYEFSKYFTDLFLIEFPEYIQLVMLAFFVHILVNKKFLGHVISIGIWIAMFSIRDFAEYDFNMFFYSYTPGYRVSDMNGFGHFLKALSWFNVYWLAFGAALMIIGNLLWPRGSEDSWKTRIKLFKQRFNKVSAPALILSLMIFVGCGFVIYYNTSILNTYQTSDEGKEQQADYEKKYSRYQYIPQPKITDVFLTADVYPEERRTISKVDVVVVNKTDKTIDTLYFTHSTPLEHAVVDNISFNGAELEKVFEDEALNFTKYVLPTPM